MILSNYNSIIVGCARLSYGVSVVHMLKTRNQSKPIPVSRHYHRAI